MSERRHKFSDENDEINLIQLNFVLCAVFDFSRESKYIFRV